MFLNPIKTKNDYKSALNQLESVFEAKDGTTESDTADILALMIDDYEQKNYPIESPDPIKAIKIRMEEYKLA